jgi:hypothetical protein
MFTLIENRSSESLDNGRCQYIYTKSEISGMRFMLSSPTTQNKTTNITVIFKVANGFKEKSFLGEIEGYYDFDMYKINKLIKEYNTNKDIVVIDDLKYDILACAKFIEK